MRDYLLVVFIFFGFTACTRADTSPLVATYPVEKIRLGGPTPSEAPVEVFGTGSVLLPNGKTLRVETARTPDQRSQGLMFRTELDAEAGMLFYFGRQQPLTFWMKNTLIDLDMIFIADDKTITVIRANVPRSRRDTSDPKVATRSGSGKYVLELPAGAAKRFGLKIGQRLTFDD